MGKASSQPQPRGNDSFTQQQPGMSPRQSFNAPSGYGGQPVIANSGGAAPPQAGRSGGGPSPGGQGGGLGPNAMAQLHAMGQSNANMPPPSQGMPPGEIDPSGAQAPYQLAQAPRPQSPWVNSLQAQPRIAQALRER